MNYIAIGFFLATIALTLVITVWAASRSKSRADYYVAGGNITGVQNGMAIAGDFMSATTFLGITGMYFTSGVDPATVYYLAPLIGLPLLLLWIASPLRRAGKFTLGDVMTSRLGSPSLRLFSGLTVVVISIIYLIGQLVGAGALISILFGLNFATSVIVVSILMTIYVAGGGMIAATWVQIIKAGLLAVGVTVLAVMCLVEGGGFGALYQRAADVHPLGQGLFMPGAGKMDLFSSVSLLFGMAVGFMGLPHLLIRIFTVPNPAAARTSMVTATSIVGFVFALLFMVVGPATIVFVRDQPQFLDAAGKLIGGPNMVAVNLSQAVGGPILMGIIAAVAFATILAVVSGLVMATASAVSHDLYGVLKGSKADTEHGELRVFRIAAGVTAVIAIALAFAFQNENVAFLSALALSVAASANFPVLFLVLYWPRLTTAGALAGGLVGLIASVSLIVVGPAVWVKILHNPTPLFPSDYPALVTTPLAFAVAILVSLISRAQQPVAAGAAAE